MSVDWQQTVFARPTVADLHYNQMCTCSVHCANVCEPQHCNVWCLCWCHAEEYRTDEREVA